MSCMKIKITLLTLIALISVAPAYADNNLKVARQSIHSDRAQLRDSIRQEVGNATTTNKQEREDLHTDVKSKIDSLKAQVETIKNSDQTQEQKQKQIEDLKLSVKSEIDAKRTEVKASIDARRTSLKSEIQKQVDDFKDAKKVKLDDAKKTQVTAKLNGVFAKLDNAITQLSSFNDKISLAIANRKVKGMDTSAAELALVSAQGALEEAKISVDAVKTTASSTINSTGGSSSDALKAIVQTAVTSIKNARDKYKTVIGLLPRNPRPGEATTTDSGVATSTNN